MTRIYLASIGCRLNQSEMDSLARRLAGQGHQIVHSPVEAELTILNTCAVTREAERKSRQASRRFHRQNPGAPVVVTGCYATLSPAEAVALPGAIRVVSNADKKELPAILDLEQEIGRKALWQLPGGRTRAFVQIQDGCDNRCSYCVTTIARGDAHSRLAAEIIEEIEALAAANYQEVVLTGVHVGSYGREMNRDRPESCPSLYALVKMILSETSIPRLRLSSLEPWDLETGFFKLWENPRLCRQLHLPLQSGSATILRRMARRITPEKYRNLAAAALAAIPDLALTTDIIVGFPGESEEEFAASLNFVEQVDFARLHVFPFSPRPGTVAASMEGQIPHTVIRERSQRMRELGRQKQESFLRRFLGRRMAVLWESTAGPAKDDGSKIWRGHTDNYIPVTAAADRPLRNTITPVLLAELRPGGIWGRIRSRT
jgi:threonylcarbamoyladenosine tRNA methylthiotransferase MtaB